MRPENRTDLGKKINAVMSVSSNGKLIGPEALDLWMDLLGNFDLHQVSGALIKYASTNRFAPAPSDIIDILSGDLGYPSPEEAWNRLPKGENDGGYVNQQMMDAWGACSDSLERGDMISARMAFLESYKKNVETAKLNGQPADYFYSSPTSIGREERLEKKHQDLLLAINLGWVDKNMASVKQMLAITSEDKPIALEDLSKKASSKTKTDNLKSIRARLNMG